MISDEELKKLTADYNEKRRSLGFLTVAASESGIRSVLKLNPYMDDLSWDEKIVHIARYISDLAFW